MIDETADATRKMQFLFALRSRGVTDAAVLSAMEKIDRGLFVRGLFAERAYEDMPLPIACGQTISQPSVVGLMTQALQVSPRDKVMEVGTGSGYQAAVLSQLARRVYTVDRHRRLVREAREVFDALDLANITAFTADGSSTVTVGDSAASATIQGAIDVAGSEGTVIIPEGNYSGSESHRTHASHQQC